VELTVALVIVALLAAVAVPLYRRSLEHARSAEAIAALGMIRSAMRVHKTETGSYASAQFTDGTVVTVGGVLGIAEEDLMGRYFSASCYTFDGRARQSAFTVECSGANSFAQRRADVLGVVATIDQDGTVRVVW
jgi:type II secretory pathway pseudopilin PulG